jgi:hypothetical protein
MEILATLAYIPENIQGEENSFTAEFMILLRKQITHTNIRTRCFGVLGTIAEVKQLSIQSKDDSNDSKNEILISVLIYLSVNDSYIFLSEKIDGLLALVWTSIENDEEACSIFFDEMISCIKVLPKNICIQLRKILKTQFEVIIHVLFYFCTAYKIWLILINANISL